MRSQPDASNWAVNAFADAELGDLRRTKRLVELAHVLAQHPTAALPEACGDGAMLKAAYRFFSNDDIKPQDFLDSHIGATRQCGSIGTGGCNASMKLCVSSSRCESCPAKGEPARAGSQPCAGVRNGLGDA